MQQRIHITTGLSSRLGVCEFCTRYNINPCTSHEHTVYEVELVKGHKVRFCPRCAKDFRIRTREADRPKKPGEEWRQWSCEPRLIAKTCVTVRESGWTIHTITNVCDTLAYVIAYRVVPVRAK